MASVVGAWFVPDHILMNSNCRFNTMKPIAIPFVLILALAASACTYRSDLPPSAPKGAKEDDIHFERNTEFTGPRLRVFVTLEDGSEVSVNTADDAVDTQPGITPIPVHQARDWTIVKDTEDGTSIAYALVSWDPGDPDFATNTLSGCIGCTGDLITRRAHFGIFLGHETRDVQAIAAGYELRFGQTAISPDGTFEHTDVMVSHPERSVTQSEGHWGGSLSNIPDRAGNPRLAAGFSSAEFEESDGSTGAFLGTFVALAETFGASGR